MLVLLSFGLVLVATVLLVLGLLSDEGLMLIWLSIASSVAAALVLVLALKLNKPRDEVRTAAPEPLPVPEPEPQPAVALAATTAGSAAVPASTTETDEWLAADQDTWSADDWSDGAEVEFPIADYDTLTSGQILPLLPQLYEDEIPVVEERERATKARPEILQKLAELRGVSAPVEEPESEPVEPVEPVALEAPAPSAESVPAVDPLASYTEPAATSWDDDWFPIEDYESLSAAQIRPLLPELDAEELEMVRDKELELGRRRSLLDEIDRLMPGSQPAAPAEATFAAPPVAEPAPVKKTTARKTTAKKATAKAAPAKKAASTGKAATKRSAPAKTTAAKKASAATKAATKKSVKKTSAKKATAKSTSKATAKKTTKKAAPAKTGVKKSAAAKKTTRRPTDG